MIRFPLKRATLPAVLGAGALIAACGGAADRGAAVGDSTAAGMTAGLPATTDTAAGAVAGTMSNAEILGAVRSVNESEIAAGQLASTKGTNQAVRQFGQMMVTDHRALNQQTTALMDSLSIAAGTMQDSSMMQQSQAMLQQMQQQPKGAAWDSAYIASQVTGHQQAIDLLNRASNATQDPQVSNLIQTARPKIQSHLDEATRIQGTLGS